MSQSQEDRLRLGHKRYGKVTNDAPKGGMFICDKCGGVDRISVLTKIGGQEICETCVDQYLIKSASNDKDEAWRPAENTIVEWKCEKCGRTAKASDVYDEKIDMEGECGGKMLKIKNSAMKAPWRCDECDVMLKTDSAVKEHKSDTGHSSYAAITENAKYLCPHCGRNVEKKGNRYYCSKCDSSYDMEDLTGEDAQNAKGDKCPSCGSTETFAYKGTQGDNTACSICDRTWKAENAKPKCTSCGKEIEGKPYIYEPTLKPYCWECIGEASMK